ELRRTMTPGLVAPSPRQSESVGARLLPTLIVAAGFTVLVFALRSSTFFHSTENWDESLYLLMSRSLLHGHPPYTQVWNHKPPGIVLLFALGQVVFGPTVLSIRILAGLAVSTSCLLLYFIGRSLRDPTTGIVAGFLYAAFSLDYGRSSCLELFYTPLLLLAFFLVLSREVDELLDSSVVPLVLGFVGGLALQLKFVIVFDLAALCLFVLLLWRQGGRAQPMRLLRFFALAAVGPAVLFAITILSFPLAGHPLDYLP